MSIFSSSPVDSPLESSHSRLCPKSSHPSELLTRSSQLLAIVTKSSHKLLEFPLLPSGSCFLFFFSSKHLFRIYPTARKLVFLQVMFIKFSYLIFVIFSPRVQFLAQFFSTQKRVNRTKKISRQNSVTCKKLILQQNIAICSKIP